MPKSATVPKAKLCYICESASRSVCARIIFAKSVINQLGELNTVLGSILAQQFLKPNVSLEWTLAAPLWGSLAIQLRPMFLKMGHCYAGSLVFFRVAMQLLWPCSARPLRWLPKMMHFGRQLPAIRQHQRQAVERGSKLCSWKSSGAGSLRFSPT